MKTPIQITNTSPTPFTIKKNTVVAEFHITTPNEAKNIKPSTRVRKRTAGNDEKTKNDPTVLVPRPKQPG